MGSCLPTFLLVSTSIPVTLQSQLPDPAFTELAATQRPESRLSSPITTQPPRASSPVPLYRRFSKWEAKRRARSAPEGTYPAAGDPDQDHESEPTGRFRKTRSAPPNMEAPVVHEHWVGTKKEQRGKRRVSDPVKPLSPIGDGASESKINRNSAPPPARSPFARPSSSGSSRNSLDSSRTSSVSTPLQSPAIGPEVKVSSPPSPGLQTLDEEGFVEEFAEEKHFLPPLCLPSLHLSCPLSPSISTIGEMDIAESDRNSDATPSRRPSKRVSFASASPQIITPASDAILEDTASLRKQKSWSGLFHVNTPPAVALARPVPLTRQGSVQSIKGQAAGKSILRRTSSFSSQLSADENAPVIVRKPLPRTRSGRSTRSASPPPPMPSVPEKDLVDFDLEEVPLSPQSSSARSELSSPVEEVAVQVNFARIAVPQPKQTVVVNRPKKPEPAQLMHQRAVRHWSMQTSGNWIRRSGMYVQGGNVVDKDVPPVPPLPRDMLKV